MISAQPIETVAEILEKTLEAPVEDLGDLYIVTKQRDLAITSGECTMLFKITNEITFQDLHQQGKMLNKAEILLLPEGLAVFSSALVNQGSSLPSNYTQGLVMELDVYSLYMESRELPKQFAGRLAAALKAIEL